MSKAHSIASKKRWDNIPKPARSRIARLMVNKRWDNTTKEERRQIGIGLVKARNKKINGL